MTDGQARLAEAERHVEECKQDIFAQEQLVAKFVRERVADLGNAVALLTLLRDALQLAEQNRDIVRVMLEAELAGETMRH